MRVAILIPVLDRPHRVEQVLRSIEDTGQVVDLLPLFLVSPNDEAELAAIEAAEIWHEVVTWEPGQGDYARKMNLGLEIASTAKCDFAFLGADDLRFHAGWIERALAAWQETRCCVIGTNDLGNQRVKQGRHSTHTLVHLAYLECGAIDGPELLHPGYWHNYVDDEFVQTAIYRDTFTAALDSRVEHLHADWGKAPRDATYIKGKEHFYDDKALYETRSRLYGGTRRPRR